MGLSSCSCLTSVQNKLQRVNLKYENKLFRNIVNGIAVSSLEANKLSFFELLLKGFIFYFFAIQVWIRQMCPGGNALWCDSKWHVRGTSQQRELDRGISLVCTVAGNAVAKPRLMSPCTYSMQCMLRLELSVSSLSKKRIADRKTGGSETTITPLSAKGGRRRLQDSFNHVIPPQGRKGLCRTWCIFDRQLNVSVWPLEPKVIYRAWEQPWSDWLAVGLVADEKHWVRMTF